MVYMGSYDNIPKAIFYLTKGIVTLLDLVPQVGLRGLEVGELLHFSQCSPFATKVNTLPTP